MPAPRPLRAVLLAGLVPTVLLFAAGPLAGAGCALSQAEATPTETTPAGPLAGPPAEGDTLRLALGETAERGGHTVRFAEVVEDSRCPQGAQCVTAGRARVRVEVDGEPAVLSVPHARMAGDEASTVRRGALAVTAVDLEPAPGAAGAAPVAGLQTQAVAD